MKCFFPAIAMLIAFLAMPVYTNGQRLSSDETSRFFTIPHDTALAKAIAEAPLEMVAVQHEGWSETLPTFASLKLHEITGRGKIRGQDPVYTLLSIVYTPERWQTARVLPVEHPRLLETLSLDGKWVSPRQVKQSAGLNGLIEELETAARRNAELRRVRKVLNAVEQAHRLGANERVLTQYENDPNIPVPASEVARLLEKPEELKPLHDRRRELQGLLDRDKAYTEAGGKLLDRAMALDHLKETLLIIPDAESIDGSWMKIGSMAAARGITQAGEAFDDALRQAFVAGNPGGLGAATTQFLSIAERSRLYPTENFRKAQNWYIFTNPWRIAAWIYLLSACLYGLFLFFHSRSFYWPALGLGVLGFLFHTSAVGLRFYLKGHIPVSNMFEAVTFCSWAVMLIALIVETFSRKALVGLGAAILAFLLLTGAGLMPIHQTRIHPLRAVLNSYWLNIHVTMMLVSYAAFALASVFAVIYLVRSLSAREARLAGLIGIGGGGALALVYTLLTNSEAVLQTSASWLNNIVNAFEIATLLGGGFLLIGGAISVGGYGIRTGIDKLRSGRPSRASIMTLEQTEQFCYRLVQLGWPILTLGVALGAVWADTAWGRFWGWDPKETWAFITWIAYTVYLHVRMVMGWRGRWSAAACLLGFIMVLITWLGVSYLPWFSGGLHSYASPT